MYGSENDLQDLVLFSHHLGPRDRALFLRLGKKCFYMLSPPPLTILIPDFCPLIQGYITIWKIWATNHFWIKCIVERVFVNNVFSVTLIQDSFREVLLLQRRYVTAHCCFPPRRHSEHSFSSGIACHDDIVRMIDITCKLCRQIMMTERKAMPGITPSCQRTSLSCFFSCSLVFEKYQWLSLLICTSRRNINSQLFCPGFFCT